MRAIGMADMPIAPRSPWQNAYCERVIGTLRRDLFDQVIILNEAHARRMLREYVAYYLRDRTHLSLAKDAPEGRAVEPPCAGTVSSRDVLGGLHHRYYRQAA